MITAEFSRDFRRFKLSGHAGYAEKGGDIVCAAVSSCVQFAVNTVTDVLRVPAKVAQGGGSLSLSLPRDSGAAAQLVEGLYLHLRGLAGDYPENIRVVFRPLKG